MLPEFSRYTVNTTGESTSVTGLGITGGSTLPILSLQDEKAEIQIMTINTLLNSILFIKTFYIRRFPNRTVH